MLLNEKDVKFLCMALEELKYPKGLSLTFRSLDSRDADAGVPGELTSAIFLCFCFRIALP